MIIKSFEIKNKKTLFLKKNLFLLYGENTGLKKDIKNFIKLNIKKKEESLENIIFYENEITENEEKLYDCIYSGSLFSTKKIITIYETTDKLFKNISDIYEKYPENVFLVFFANILEKKSKIRNFFENKENTICVPCYLDNQRDLESIAQLELKKNNINISREALNLLIEKANSDRDNLKNEIEKIKSYSLNKKNLEIDEIKSLINFSGDYKSDILVNECLSGNTLQYKKIISEFYLNTINQILLLRILSNKIQRLLKIKESSDKSNNLDNIINNSKPAIFWKEKPVVKKQLSIWDLRDLKSIISEINTTELLCKKNPQSSKVIFFNFFSKICKKASNFS